jgi:hypothetical protein
MMTKDLILAATDSPTEAVDCPEWGGTVHVRTMSGTERDAFEGSMLDAKGKGVSNLSNIRARLLVRVLCDDAGNLLFGHGDADALGKKSAKVLDRLFDVAQRVNGLGAKDVAALQGNS